MVSKSSNKLQDLNYKQNTKYKRQKSNNFDLVNRTLYFARFVRTFAKELPKNIILIDDIRQLLRSSASVGANYIEANEATSKKEFLYRLRIAKKEANETKYWLKVMDVPTTFHIEKEKLLSEIDQIIRILGAIIEKSK